MGNINRRGRLKVVRNFIIRYKTKEDCFLASCLKKKKRKCSESDLGEQMQVKQSRGESSEQFVSFCFR